MIKILIVDDNNLFRERLEVFLSLYPGIEVIDQAADGQSALSKVRELKPDVVLIDINMKGMNGLVATKWLKSEFADLKIIILSVYDLNEYREAAKQMGANAYVSKRFLDEELLPAIRRVTGNEK